MASSTLPRPGLRALPPAGESICYSGYREGQSPHDRRYPSDAQVREDLIILSEHWRYLRLYDSGPHAEIVLRVIREEGLDLRVMLGADLAAELSNPACPWGADYDEATLRANAQANREQIERQIALANDHPETVFAVAIGNEATVEWSDHLVPVEGLAEYVRHVRAATSQPVTVCDNYVPWSNSLVPVAEHLDFISVHTYPVWEFKSIQAAMDYTLENYQGVVDRYPDKPVVITEAGWTTSSNGRGIDPWNASQELQAVYCSQLLDWARQTGVLTFIFEAFDEPWKGSPDPLEPEKHWGLFTVDRAPKLVMRTGFVSRATD
jgi:exo-beta-1,3-glucanase (GH17 family)